MSDGRCLGSRDNHNTRNSNKSQLAACLWQPLAFLAAYMCIFIFYSLFRWKSVHTRFTHVTGTAAALVIPNAVVAGPVAGVVAGAVASVVACGVVGGVADVVAGAFA